MKSQENGYAIFKSRDGKDAHAVYVFTQAEHNHRAKAAAKEKLFEMWTHAVSHPDQYRNRLIETDKSIRSFRSFSYDRPTSANTTERIHFYIKEHKVSKPV